MFGFAELHAGFVCFKAWKTLVLWVCNDVLLAFVIVCVGIYGVLDSYGWIFVC